MRLIRLAVAAVALAGPALAPTYQLEASTPLVSTDTDWAGLTIADGLTVFNTGLRLVAATSTALAPEFGRGHATTSDGAVLAFELATLRPISRVQVDDGEPSRAVFEPAAKRIHLLSGARSASSAWITLDAATGHVIGRTTFLDPARRLAITANGEDATLSLIRQDGPDSYRLVETISTGPTARVLQLDGRTKRLSVLTFMPPHGP